MPVCSYVVLPEPGGVHRLSQRLATIPGCDVTRSSNRNLLLLVTDTPSPEEDRELRSTLRELEGIHALILTFGEIDPETEEADPVGADRKHRRPRRPGLAQEGSPGRPRRLPVIHPANVADLRNTARGRGDATARGSPVGADPSVQHSPSPDEADA